jgi:hypothetical protein
MVINMMMACGMAWLLFAAQKRPEDKTTGLLIALFFLSSNPVRNTIGNGQQALLILVATLLALRQYPKPLLSGIAMGIALAKYSIGLFYFVGELGRRRLIASAIALAVVLASFIGLAIQTHASFNLNLLMGPLEVSKRYPAFANQFFWINQHFGYTGVRLVPLFGLTVVFLRARALASSNLSANEVAIKLACGATFVSLLCAPHLGYDFVMLALPLALGCRLADLKKFERYLYGALLLLYWNISGFLEGLRQSIVPAIKTALVMTALALLAYVFLGKPSNRITPAENNAGL